MTKLCSYESNGTKCKNWVAIGDSAIEDPDFKPLCPLHSGITKRAENLSPAENAFNARLEHHISAANLMPDDVLAKHIDGLVALMEDVKLRHQAANIVKQRRNKASNGNLTEAQLSEINSARSAKAKAVSTSSEPKLSKEEKEIQKMIARGISREKAIKLLGLDES